MCCVCVWGKALAIWEGAIVRGEIQHAEKQENSFSERMQCARESLLQTGTPVDTVTDIAVGVVGNIRLIDSLSMESKYGCKKLYKLPANNCYFILTTIITIFSYKDKQKQQPLI